VTLSPTATQFVALAQLTPPRVLIAAPAAFGLGTLDHVVPSHWSMKVEACSMGVSASIPPTTKQFVSLEQATDPSPTPVGSGVTDQVVPSHWAIDVLTIPSSVAMAKHVVVLGHAMR